MAEITQKQKLFADEYVLTGNASQSYQKVYKCTLAVADTNGSRLLRNARVKEYIESTNKEIRNDKIADMQEVKEFWAEMLRSTEVDVKDRLKASEYIAKTNAAFIEKREISGEIKMPTIVIGK